MAALEVLHGSLGKPLHCDGDRHGNERTGNPSRRNQEGHERQNAYADGLFMTFGTIRLLQD